MEIEWGWCLASAFLFWAGYGFGIRSGTKSQRVLAVRHDLARWEPDERGRTTFFWRNSLPNELSRVEYDRDRYHNLLIEAQKERDALRAEVKKKKQEGVSQ